jgi:hypothetical protein
MLNKILTTQTHPNTKLRNIILCGLLSADYGLKNKTMGHESHQYSVYDMLSSVFRVSG